MKVAVVTQYCPTSVQRWAGHSAYQTLRHLATHCDLRVFFPEATYPRLLTPPSARRPPIDRTWSPPGVAITYIPYAVLPVISRPLNGFVMAHRLLPHIRAFQPDIILNYVVYPDGYAAVRIGRALNVPVVLSAIGSDLNRISDPLCGVLTRSALRRSSFVTAVCGDLTNTALTLGADPAHTQAILNGCDLTVFHPRDRSHARLALGIDPNAEVLVYVGRYDLRKGLLELIEAAATLRGNRPGVQCYLVGDGPDKPALLTHIARLGAADTVTLVPSCPTEQVSTWMAAANLVTLPSYREGCPNVVIEALAAGRPVVASNVGGIPELMDDSSGRLIPTHDAAALAQALAQVLDAPWDADTLSSRHSRSWAEVATELNNVLERTLNEARSVTLPPR